MTTTQDKTRHTSGPWYAVKLEASPDHAWAIDSELTEIARLSEWPEPQAEAEANARLIATAPELLDALKTLIDGIEHLDIHGAEYARQVIAKVEGRDA